MKEIDTTMIEVEMPRDFRLEKFLKIPKENVIIRKEDWYRIINLLDNINLNKR